MTYIITEQAEVFLYACLLGALLGAFYDVFRVIRLSFKHPTALVVLEDILFFAACALFTFLFSVQYTRGQGVRYFILLGEALGGVLYYFTIGALVMRISALILKLVRAVLRFIFRYFIYPVFWILGCIGNCFSKLWQKIKNICGKSNFFSKYSLKSLYDMLYNKFISRGVGMPKRGKRSVKNGNKEKKKTV